MSDGAQKQKSSGGKQTFDDVQLCSCSPKHLQPSISLLALAPAWSAPSSSNRQIS